MGVGFWDLTGPKQFIDGVCADLRDGKNVLLRLPAIPPPQCAAGLRRALIEDWSWHVVWAGDRVSPVERLFGEFASDARPQAPRTVRGLVDEDGFQGRVLFLDGVGSESWPAWKAFFEQYQHVCRAVPLHRRSRFVVPLHGPLALDAPRREVSISHRTWNGCVGELDMLLYGAGLLQERRLQLSAGQLHLLAATIAKVALWDPELAERLAEGTPQEVLDPRGLLRAVADERGWTGTTPASWELGTAGAVDGREHPHSALLVRSDPQGLLKSRLWTAQASVLLPAVEERRQWIVRQVRPQLTLPFHNGYGMVEDAFDLEIGSLAYQLRTRSVPARLRGQVERLVRVRNALAHREPLAPSDALAAELFTDG